MERYSNCPITDMSDTDIVLPHYSSAAQNIVAYITNNNRIEILVKKRGIKVLFGSNRTSPFFKQSCLLTKIGIAQLYNAACNLGRCYVSIKGLIYVARQVWTMFYYLHFNILLAKKIKSPV